MEVARNSKMQEFQVRRLEKEEHFRTRKLWEEVFSEDTTEFLDYYYSVKTKENEIYVIEDEGEIVSMLHLNPYQMRIQNKVYPTHYIVAVATHPSYRRQGLMANLLNHAMQVMKQQKEPFTFLMPASEAIYKPFGFEFVYAQERCKIRGTKGRDEALSFSFATKEECGEMSAFANHILERYDVTTHRGKEYYQTILAEQESENGGILLARQGEKLVGVFCFAKEGYVEIREPLFADEEILYQAVYYLTGTESEEVSCIGFGNEKKPMIMAKVLCPELMGDLKTMKVFLNEVV